MTAKEFCLSKRPTLQAQKYVVRGFGTYSYWLIFEKGNPMPLADGKSEGKAWAAAKTYILEKEAQNNQTSVD